MKGILETVLFLSLTCGVFGDKVKKVSVMEGESVTLNPDPSKTQGFIKIKWRFGDDGPVIAETDGNEISYPLLKERFRDRLKLNPHTGSLTINNMRINDTGRYKLQISSNTGTTYMTFSVTVSGVFGDDVKKVMEGESVTLNPDLTKIQGFMKIIWRFGDDGDGPVIADTDGHYISYFTERFRDRLKLNPHTGSLTINNMRMNDAGLYQLQISSKTDTTYMKFSVTLSDSGLSPGAVAGIVVVLLVSAAAVVGVIFYRKKISEPKNSKDGAEPKESNKPLTSGTANGEGS